MDTPDALDAIFSPSDEVAFICERPWTYAELELATRHADGNQVAQQASFVIATPTDATVINVLGALRHRRAIALGLANAPSLHPSQQALLAQYPLPKRDAAVILFTSGTTTGVPRGVVHGRAGMIAAAHLHAARFPWRTGDMWLVPLSLAHAGGLAAIVRCLVARQPFYLLPRGALLADALADARITHTSLVPTQLQDLLALPGWQASPNLRIMLLGGAAAAPSLVAAAHARGLPALTSYGATETFGQVATAPPAWLGAQPQAPAVGVALPGVTITAGTAATPAPIEVATPSLMLGYLDEISASPRTTRWRSADLGTLDGDTLSVIGRNDDVIICGGENVHPVLVEAALATTPGVVAALVWAASDARLGQVVAAALVTSPSFELDAARRHWMKRLPKAAWPRQLALTTVLPLGPTGKPSRQAAAGLPMTCITY